MTPIWNPGTQEAKREIVDLRPACETTVSENNLLLLVIDKNERFNLY